MRASVEVEKLGIPVATVACEDFVTQGSFTAAGLKMPNLPLAAYPGTINLHSGEKLQNNVETVVIDQVIHNLTVQPKEAKPSPEPEPRDIVFAGTLEEVNRFFQAREWSDGLPVIPPSSDNVEEFLKYTDHPEDTVIGVLNPDKRAATVWNIAVNGVMAGCRPEYMPLLIAIVEVMANPKFGHEHLGHTPGTEALITVNGPIIKDLGFNYEQGALRVGFQANTSIGRFWRLYLRNVAGFLPHKTDKASFGGTWRGALAENEDAIARIGWEPLSVDQGFKTGDNVITVSSCTSTDSIFSVGATTPEEILSRLAPRIVDIQLHLLILSFSGPSVRPYIVITPCIAEVLAQNGYSKDKVKQYFYEHATFSAKRFKQLRPAHNLCDAVKQGKLPKQYCQSTDPDRLVPIVWSPNDFMIAVSGDPGRDNCFIGAQNGFIGYPVSKKVELPANWQELLKEARRR
ncbi:UGSC family (seleno)protein [Chloroflexota bacterium]